MAEHTQIVSSTPRRTRIRVSPKRRNKTEMARIAKALQASPMVSSVETNLYAGTITVHHKEHALADIKTELKDLGVILMAATGVATSADSLSNAISDLDSRLCLVTGGTLNLKHLVPLGFGALAIVQLARRGLELGGAPWYLLAYFAFESFMKLNNTEEKCISADASLESAKDAA